MSETIPLPESVSMNSTVKEAVDAVANAPETISAAFDLGEKLVYGTFYTVSFLCAFPVALVIAALPRGNAVSQGIADGASAAFDRADRILGSDRLVG